MADIFLSYARTERERALPIKVALASLGLDVFFDVDGLDGGDVFPDVLDREVKSAGAVVSLWSPHALTRPWIKIESRIGKDRGVLIPVEIAALDPLHDVPAAFYDDQRIDLVDFNGDTSSPGWLKLVKSLARTLERPDLLEQEVRSHAHSSAEAADLRAELAALRTQMGELAAAKSAASSQERGRKEAFALIDDSRRVEDYRRFLQRYPEGAEAFEAERRIDILQSWSRVAHDDPDAIETWFRESRISVFPALRDEALRMQATAKKNRQGPSRIPLVLAGLVALIGVGLGGFALSQSQFWDRGEATSPEAASSVGTGPATDTTLGSGNLYDVVDTGDPLPTDIVSGERSGTASGKPDPSERDDAAWADAEARATVSAYRDYLAGDDNTRHRGRAETALQRHEQAVLRLQTALNAKGFEAGTADGAVGGQTRAGVEAYRQARGFDIASVDLAAIDAAPIQEFARSIERWSRPAPSSASTTPGEAGRNQIVVSLGADVPPPSAAKRPGETFRDALSGGGQGPEMVVIPSGTFTMGSPDSEAGRDEDEDDTAGTGGRQRTVQIGYSFAVGKYEVTWAEWEACVADGGCESNLDKTPLWGAKGDAGWGKGSRPVINVSWEDAQAYADWLSRKTGERYRLLSEAEWEYVARAGTNTPFYFGNTITPDQANYAGIYTYNGGPKGTYHQKTVPVGTYPRNAFGVHDMHGNVWEWTQDCYVDSYSGAPTDGSPRLVSDCSRRVLRGGSWGYLPQGLRSAHRFGPDPTVRNSGGGFRVARTL